MSTWSDKWRHWASVGIIRPLGSFALWSSGAFWRVFNHGEGIEQIIANGLKEWIVIESFETSSNGSLKSRTNAVKFTEAVTRNILTRQLILCVLQTKKFIKDVTGGLELDEETSGIELLALTIDLGAMMLGDESEPELPPKVDCVAASDCTDALLTCTLETFQLRAPGIWLRLSGIRITVSEAAQRDNTVR